MSASPNVLFIISDQHNAKCLGSAGHPVVRTPRLDRLAAEGVSFSCAITQNPICTPSRVSFLSGQYAQNHGYYGLGGAKPLALPSILGHFREQGYRTAAIGKIHCPHGWVQADTDFYRGAYAECDFAPGTGQSDYDVYLEKKGLLAERDDAVYPEQRDMTRMPKDARPSRLNYEDSVEGWCVREAMEFVKTAAGRPWIMQVSLPRPHQLYCPAKRFWDMYPDDLPMPPNADANMSLKPPHMRAAREAQEQGSEECLFGESGYPALRRRKLRGYYGCISQVDHAVGELLDFLRERGLEENTIVIYTSDHGEYACEFGLLEKAPGICSEAVTRIPYLWRWPGHFKAGHVSSRIVETVDLAPTVAALAGLPAFATADGKDMTPLLKGDGLDIHRVGVTENPWSKSVRKGPWRFVHYPSGMFAALPTGRVIGELYNMEKDPWEMNNLFYDPAYQDIVQEMRAELAEWVITTRRVRTIHPTAGLPAGAGTGPLTVINSSSVPAADEKISSECVRQLSRDGELNYL